jgi:hypothetical protein
MSVIHTPESEFAKEMIKWEAQRTELGPGLRPYVFQEYPKMLSKAGRVGGVPAIVDQQIAASEVQEANLLSRGFRAGQDEALKYLHASDQDAALQAANRAFQDKRMSAQAQAEAATVDEATSRHLGEIPRLPVKPRNKGGRPKKVRPTEETS